MRILVDIGHPAHVHLFKNTAHEMISKGNAFYFTVREGENESVLLNENGFKYSVIGKKQKGALRKILKLFTFSYRILKVARNFKPDLFLSHGSMYAGYAALIYGKKHIALEDTGNMEQLFFSKPVSNVILSPRSLQVDLGRKHIKYDGFHELAYLHPARFKPDIAVLNELNLQKDEKYIIIRFVSWNATHDIGQTGFSFAQKARLIEEISRHVRIFISGEESLPEEFARFGLKIPPGRFHHALAFAAMHIGEGATTVSECAMLGTPALYVNSISAGTLKQQEKYGLVTCLKQTDGIIEKVIELLQFPQLKAEFQHRRRKMLLENIDVTSFLVWFIENFPGSKDKLKKDPSFQGTFKR